MDGHFVPNITIGPMVVKALRPYGQAFDVHLMISPVDLYLGGFAEAGADFISFHPEAGAHPHRTVQAIKALGCKAGLVLNPATPVDVLDYLIEDLDLVLLMSVNPGFGGQKFISSQLRKIDVVRKKIEATGKAIHLEVDGGVDVETARQCVRRGGCAGGGHVQLPGWAGTLCREHRGAEKGRVNDVGGRGTSGASPSGSREGTARSRAIP
jgi:ribulose-phosphate 3-epimerase